MPLMFFCFTVLLTVASIGYAESRIPMKVLEDEFAYKVSLDFKDCRISLERPKNNLGFVHYRNGCQQSLEEKLVVLTSMIQVLMRDGSDRIPLHTLFVGRLLPTFPAMARRVAIAASELPEWDAKRAWKEPGYSNRIFLQLLNEPHISQELHAALARIGYNIGAVSVEKVLMATPHDMPFGDWLLAQGADPEKKLPFDAMVWINLSHHVQR